MKLALLFRSLIRNKKGQDLVEYALIAALISLAAVAGVQSLAVDVNRTYRHIARTFNYEMGQRGGYHH